MPFHNLQSYNFSLSVYADDILDLYVTKALDYLKSNGVISDAQYRWVHSSQIGGTLAHIIRDDYYTCQLSLKLSIDACVSFAYIDNTLVECKVSDVNIRCAAIALEAPSNNAGGK